jgi:hypothetical protein
MRSIGKANRRLNGLPITLDKASSFGSVIVAAKVAATFFRRLLLSPMLEVRNSPISPSENLLFYQFSTGRTLLRQAFFVYFAIAVVVIPIVYVLSTNRVMRDIP